MYNKVGLDVKEVIRSRSKIIAAFYKLEESAILHVRTYLAKLGIISWAPDFAQSPYSMYNTKPRHPVFAPSALRRNQPFFTQVEGEHSEYKYALDILPLITSACGG
ncbi:hypothetical protein B0H10DRAFT_2027635 [Mycena sp. CBHHK59/15]|nr:hypothetical protein B0H10DRAFT_2027635 [Mycena sp. CBHHK59/15]